MPFALTHIDTTSANHLDRGDTTWPCSEVTVLSPELHCARKGDQKSGDGVTRSC